MSVSIETRASWGELIKGVGVQFAEVFNQGLNSYSMAVDDALATPGNKLSALAKQLPTDKAVEHYIQKTGLNYLSVTPEGKAFNSDSRILGYKTSVTSQLFSSSVTVSYQAVEDRDYKQQLDEFADLSTSAKETMDKLFFDMFNYAFTAQTSLPIWLYGYGDGKPLCSVSHPRKDGGAVQANTFATATTQLPYSETNLETARVALNRQLDDRGKPTKGGGGKLILLVPSELEKQAVIDTKSVKRSGTANNDINVYDGVMTVIASKWLTSSTAYFLIDPRVARLIISLRQGAKSHKFTDPNTLATTFYIICRFAIAWCDFRGVFGSLGDSSAYAL